MRSCSASTVAAAFGAVLALPALRVTGPYLAMVTLAFGTIIHILINELMVLTNGPLGITMNRPYFLDWRPLAEYFPFFKMNVKHLKEIQFYYLAVICLLLTIVAVNRIVASRYGRAFEALRDSPIALGLHGGQRLPPQGLRLRPLGRLLLDWRARCSLIRTASISRRTTSTSS